MANSPRHTVETPLGELPGSIVGALGPHLRSIRHRPGLVIGFALIALIAAVAFNVVRPAAYEAEGQIIVTPRPPGDLSLGALPVVHATPGYPGRPTATVGAFIHTEQVAAEAARRLGESDPAALFQQVEVKPDPDANVLVVKAPGDTGDQAAGRVNAYMEGAVAVRKSKLEPIVRSEIRGARNTLASLSDQRSAQAEALRNRIGELRSVADGTDPTFTIVREAVVPQDRAGLPLWMLLLGSTLAGALIGAGTAILSRLLGPRQAASEQELHESFPVEILGRVPDFEVLRRSETGAAAAVEGGFRALRSRLALGSADLGRPGVPKGLIVITSGSRGDGRTTVATGLARSIDGIGGATAVVDLDLASAGPSVGSLLGTLGSGPVHLGDGFTATAALDGSFVIDPDSPEDGISFDRIIRGGRNLVRDLLGTADCVIVDGPPLGEFADLLEMAAIADHLIVVGRVGHTTDRSMRALAESLASGAVDPSGLVVLASDRIDPDRAPLSFGHKPDAGAAQRHNGQHRGPTTPVAYGSRRPG